MRKKVNGPKQMDFWSIWFLLTQNLHFIYISFQKYQIVVMSDFVSLLDHQVFSGFRFSLETSDFLRGLKYIWDLETLMSDNYNQIDWRNHMWSTVSSFPNSLKCISGVDSWLSSIFCIPLLDKRDNARVHETNIGRSMGDKRGIVLDTIEGKGSRKTDEIHPRRPLKDNLSSG